MLLYLVVVVFLNGAQDPHSTLHVDVASTSQIVPKPSKSFTSNFFFTLIDGLVGCMCMCATVPRFDGEHSPLLSDPTGLRKSYL